MPTSAALARRIDRLARRAHAFHRFAHHPLCDRYSGELIALRSRTRICRGCSNALIGACAGAGTALLAPLPFLPLVLASSAILALSWRSGWRPTAIAPGGPALTRAGSLTRPSKFWTRAIPAFACSAALTSCARDFGALQIAVGLALALAMAASLYGYRRRGPDRTPCLHCPEYDQGHTCSGYRDIVRAERAFVRRAQRLIDQQASQLLVGS